MLTFPEGKEISQNKKIVMPLEQNFKTPILLNVFNRPEETKRIISILKEERVPILYVHCDGARLNNPEDEKNIAIVRKLIDDSISWDCDIHKYYEDKNLGCGLGPYAAISWFFSNVQEGIILEDDCLPNKDFFIYCQELLEKYRENLKVATIGGTCRFPDKMAQYSYRFSAYTEIWGWATWRRVWEHYEFNFNVPEKLFFLKTWAHTLSWHAARRWTRILCNSIREGESKTYWDYQLELISLYDKKIHIIPNVNLISNIGHNERGTHTLSPNCAWSNLPTDSILPLKHPKHITLSHKDNREYFNLRRSLSNKIRILTCFVKGLGK